jgi:fermentation-respiration switch protein FrsA (DUF1100 family)
VYDLGENVSTLASRQKREIFTMHSPANSQLARNDPRPKRPRWKRALRLVASGLFIYLTVVLCMMFFERPLIFPAPRGGDWQAKRFAHEDAWFNAPDGTKLHGFFFEHPQAREVILYAHGNGENVAHLAPYMDQIRRDLDVSIMVFDYRGYGQCEGRPDEHGILADARAARAWLAHRTGKAEEEIVLFGRSLGGVVLVDLAATDGARGLILHNTISCLCDVAGYHYPYLPVRWLLRTRLDACAKIGDYTGPLLQFHGSEDQIVPVRFGRRLFDAATTADKEFIELPGYDHNDADWSAVRMSIKAFLDRLPPQGPAAESY